MAVNVEEIKKMSDHDKLKLIDELLKSIDDETIEEYLSEEMDETSNILNERIAKYESGNMKFSPLEDVISRLRKRSEDRNRK
ncbi:MAG: addiction module protein [Bacteroidetes bacterium]|nr:addiction module protein [Bacteroidota bacterium]